MYYRCQCGKISKPKIGRPSLKVNVSYNKGLSCVDCTHLPCTACKKSNNYALDKTTTKNVLGLTVRCPQGCQERLKMSSLKPHMRYTCSQRENRKAASSCSQERRPCKFIWTGCSVEGNTQELLEHEKNESHLGSAMLMIENLIKRNELLEKAATNTQTTSGPQPKVA